MTSPLLLSLQRSHNRLAGGGRYISPAIATAM